MFCLLALAWLLTGCKDVKFDNFFGSTNYLGLKRRSEAFCDQLVKFSSLEADPPLLLLELSIFVTRKKRHYAGILGQDHKIKL